MIHIVDAARFKIDRVFVKNAVLAYLNSALGEEVAKITSLNVIFVGKRKMEYIATVYKREPEALPVLTFSYKADTKLSSTPLGDAYSLLNPPEPHSAHSEEGFLGEIFICYPQAVLLAAERNKRVNDTLQSLLEHGLQNLMKS